VRRRRKRGKIIELQPPVNRAAQELIELLENTGAPLGKGAGSFQNAMLRKSNDDSQINLGGSRT